MVFTNADGVEISLSRLKPLLIKNIDKSYKDRTPAPPVPTYQGETFGGEFETLPHNASTIETDEEKQEFATYLEKMKEWEAGLNNLLLRAMIIKGVDWSQIEISEDWKADQEFLGVTIPDDEREFKVLYFENELVADPDDLLKMMQSIMRLSGLSEEALSEAGELFRGETQGTEDNSGDAS